MNIVIVGGGTAGWLSALMLSKISGEKHNISLVESEKIATIGVGEGSTGFLRGVIDSVVWSYGCNEFDFMKQAKATPKLGILFKDWLSVGSSYMEPIDVADGDNFFDSNPLLSFYVSNETPFSLSSLAGVLLEKKASPFFLDKGSISHSNVHAYHFDSFLASEYFKKIVGTDVKKINGDVVDISLDSNGLVEKIILSNGESLFADFFIDASGFSRIFKNKMEVKFLEFKEMTLNSAIPFRLSTKQHSNTNFYTVAWAQKYGWLWMIPKLDEIGCGYIYDDRYINEDDAQKEIEKTLKTEIEVKRKISFTPGRLENPWNKNVLSVGLSYQFLEPLEATSIHAIISQLNIFSLLYLKNTKERTINEENIKAYNDQMNCLVEDLKDFILIHYLNCRSDTEFWRNMNGSAEKNKKILKYVNISKNRLLNFYDVENVYGGANTLYNWPLIGMKHFSKDSALLEIQKDDRLFHATNQEAALHQYLSEKDWIDPQSLINFLSQKS